MNKTSLKKKKKKKNQEICVPTVYCQLSRVWRKNYTKENKVRYQKITDTVPTRAHEEWIYRTSLKHLKVSHNSSSYCRLIYNSKHTRHRAKGTYFINAITSIIFDLHIRSHHGGDEWQVILEKSRVGTGTISDFS